MFEQKTVNMIAKKMSWEYSLNELHAIVGNFEKEYNENSTGKVIRNEILGYVTPKEIENAVETKVIKRIRNGKSVRYVITTDEIIINGKKKLVASQAYLDYEKRRRARRGASYYKSQELDAIIHQKEMDEALKEVDEIFPNSARV